MFDLSDVINEMSTPVRNKISYSKIGLMSTANFKNDRSNFISGGSIPTPVQHQLSLSTNDLENEVLSQIGDEEKSLLSIEDELLDSASESSLLVEDVLRGVLTPVAKENALPYLPTITKTNQKVLLSKGKRNLHDANFKNNNLIPSKKFKKYKTNLVLLEAVLRILKSTINDGDKIKQLYNLCNTDEDYVFLIGVIHNWLNQYPNYEFINQFIKKMFTLNIREITLKKFLQSNDEDVIYFMEICSYLYERNDLRSILHELDLSITECILSEIIKFRSKQYVNDSSRFSQEYLLMKYNCKPDLHTNLLCLLTKQYKLEES